MTTAAGRNRYSRPMGAPRYLILGATGGPGLGTFLHLAREGAKVTGIGRNPQHVEVLNSFLRSRDLPGRVVQMDLWRPPPDLADLVMQATVLVSASQANFATHCMQLPHRLERLVAVSSIRLYSRFPHPLIPPIAELRDLVENGPVSGVLLLTTMQTGGVGYNNLERLAQLARLSPVIPLPFAAAEALVQPIHTDDVVHCIRRCLDQMPGSPVVALGGPVQLRYADLIRHVGAAVGRTVRTPTVPDSIVHLAATVLSSLPGGPGISAEELRRVAEDKVCDTAEMVRLFGIEPRPLQYEEPILDYHDAIKRVFASLESSDAH